jgi:dinuclear metal center YbgI/SA1388 family protein
MAQLSEIIRHLETIAPPSLQESYDNSGLITGSPDQEITGILVCLDSTEQVIDEAINTGCNLIVAHHPIVFSGLKKITGRTYVERVIIKAIRNNLAIYAIHTNLDNVYHGVNKRFAEKLGLENTRILSPLSGKLRKLVTFVPHVDAEKVRAAICEAGAGDISNYSDCSFNIEGIGTFKGNDLSNPVVGKKGELRREPETRIETIYPVWKEREILAALRTAHPYEEIAYNIYPLENKLDTVGAGLIGTLPQPMPSSLFLDRLKENMQAVVIRHTALVKKEISKVVLCGGSGSFLLNHAINAGADIFISADFKYHQFFDADGRIIIADIGHFETEQFTIDLLAELLSVKFTTFAVRLTGTQTNPIIYR